MTSHIAPPDKTSFSREINKVQIWIFQYCLPKSHWRKHRSLMKLQWTDFKLCVLSPLFWNIPRMYRYSGHLVSAYAKKKGFQAQQSFCHQPWLYKIFFILFNQPLPNVFLYSFLLRSKGLHILIVIFWTLVTFFFF